MDELDGVADNEVVAFSGGGLRWIEPGEGVLFAWIDADFRYDW